MATENELLREEVEVQKREAHEREEREKREEQLKNRVSVAAIVLTTALSFIGNVKSDRNDAAGSAKGSAEAARRQSAELWAYYQTALAARTTMEVARDRIRLDLSGLLNKAAAGLPRASQTALRDMRPSSPCHF